MVKIYILIKFNNKVRTSKNERIRRRVYRITLLSQRSLSGELSPAKSSAISFSGDIELGAIFLRSGHLFPGDIRRRLSISFFFGRLTPAISFSGNTSYSGEGFLTVTRTNRIPVSVSCQRPEILGFRPVNPAIIFQQIRRPGMASKLVMNRLRSLCRVSQLSDVRFDKLRDPNSIFSSSQIHVKRRSYSEASQPTLINPPPPPNTSTTSSSLNEFELAKFSAIAETWWNAEGPFKPLHLMNPTRLAFIRSTLCWHFRKDPNCTRPFEGLKFIDVGCGGGILSEPLARMGATVTGVDAVDKNIKIARLHADLDPQTSSIEYRCTTAESLVEEQRQFDAVLALEVIEHVADPAGFCKSLSALTIPGGATVISSINRSMRAYATAIIAAEYLLHWLPKGTHQWSSFLTPEELVLILQRASITVQEMAGFVYNPLTGRWSLSDDISVNFIAFGTKPANKDETLD